jgi:hypothetical protein
MEVGGWVVFHFNADIWNGGWNTAVIGTSGLSNFCWRPILLRCMQRPGMFPPRVSIQDYDLKP